VVERARLEIVCTFKAYRGFESLPLRDRTPKFETLLSYAYRGFDQFVTTDKLVRDGEAVTARRVTVQQVPA
jgi:hypothetical protein